MKNIYFSKPYYKTALLVVMCLMVSLVNAQEDTEKAEKVAKKYMQEAEEALADNDMATAEAFYRKAIAKDPANAEARYNLGNLYYNKEITGEAVDRHGQAATVTDKKPLKHDSFHNRGNAFMKQKKYKEAVEAYKNSLRNNPADDETRYNLALAKKLLEEEEKKGGGGDKDKQDENKDKKEDQKDQQGDEGEKEKNKDGKPEEKGDQKDSEDKKEGEDKKDEEGKPKDQDQKDKAGNPDQQQEPKQTQPRPGQLSPQQVKNLLDAMGNEEKKVQEKINAEKVKGIPKKTEKDW